MSIDIGTYDKLWAFRSFPEVYNDIDVFELQEQSLISYAIYRSIW